MMQRIGWIVVFVALFFSACEENSVVLPEESSGIPLLFAPLRSAASDPDNLASEYNIVNLHVFLTNTGSATITNKFINQSFISTNDTTVMNCKMATLPLDQTTVTSKDVYVIANCSDVTSLNAVQTVADLKALTTPQATTASGLTTDNGLPMFGQITNANLGASTTANPVSVMLTRTCAKLRITLTFTSASYTGSNNQFAIENASAYTYFVKNDTFKINSSQLLTYPQMPFVQQTARQFQGITYVYESLQIPRLHIYTTVNGTPKDYVASSNFPLPVRNYLYDIQIQIMPPSQSSAPQNMRSAGDSEELKAKIIIRTYGSSEADVAIMEYMDILTPP
ncbi:hypothetical protein FACS1894182_03500 [Bacteroidia bacterium]|nr:hypothetical protein FACS1894182_03500 [Bacteroidia bacterium]